MRKVQTVGTVSQFLNRQKPDSKVNIEQHFKKYGFVYKVVGATVIILMSGGAFDYAFASSPMSAPSVDLMVRSLYNELIGIGKWVIIFKGGIDIIKSVGNGDFDTAKKSFFSYLMVYLLLLGLPYGMDKVDQIFNQLPKS